MQAKLLAIRDTGFIPEPLMASLRGDQPPMAYVADDARYPLARLIPLVDRMQIQRDAAAVDAALIDLHVAVRYWGATASYVLEKEPTGLTALLNDGNVAVRVAAAESILRRHADSAPVAVINTVLISKELWPVRLAAANAVSRLTDRAPFMDSLKAAVQSEEYLGRIVPWLLEPKR